MDKEFGWTSNFDGFHETKRPGDLPLYYIRKMKRGVGYIAPKSVTKSQDLIDTWKVLVPEAFNGGDGVPHQIMGKPLIAPSPSVCTQSFLFFYVSTCKEAKSIRSYYMTRFFSLPCLAEKDHPTCDTLDIHVGAATGLEPYLV